jgi:hypothetical protein
LFNIYYVPGKTDDIFYFTLGLDGLLTVLMVQPPEVNAAMGGTLLVPEFCSMRQPRNQRKELAAGTTAKREISRTEAYLRAFARVAATLTTLLTALAALAQAADHLIRQIL